MAGRGRGDVPINPHFEWMQNMMEMQQKMMQDMMQFRQQARQHQPLQAPPPQVDPKQAYAKFYKMNPSEYRGESNAMGAQHWLDDIERIFETLQSNEEEKVRLASHMLKGEAFTWWKNTRVLMAAQGTAVTWENFRRLFLDQFFPNAMKIEKEQEFLTLKQNDMTVAEYTTKFEELSQFYELASYAPNDRWKINRYKQGLREDIAESLGSFTCTSYAALAQQAYVVEGDLRRLYASRRRNRQNKKGNPNQDKIIGQSIQSSESDNESNHDEQVYTPEMPKMGQCAKCGRYHKGECHRGSLLCYYCKKEGHYARDCPQGKNKKRAQATTQTQGRVYMLDAKTDKGKETSRESC